MSARKDEILAKKAKLAELKRQRELRQKDFTVKRDSVADSEDLPAPIPSRSDHRKELDSLISSLVGDARTSSPVKGSQQTSATAAGLSGDEGQLSKRPDAQPHETATTLPILSIASSTTVYDFPAAPKPQYITYSKGVQTSEPVTYRANTADWSDSEYDVSKSPRKAKRLSRRDREKEAELRQHLRGEIEEELRKHQHPDAQEAKANTAGQARFTAKTLDEEQQSAVTASAEFRDFLDRSSKVADRAIDEDYDILADYALRHVNLDDEDEGYGSSTGSKGRRIRESIQFYDERWSKKRMITSLDFSPKFPELLLAAYTKNLTAPHDPSGLIQVWNAHMPSRPEYLFSSLSSEITAAKFSPFHPSLIIGGTYSGQILLWDTRSRSSHGAHRSPVATSASSWIRGGGGHMHPVYAVEVVGTQNAHNIVSVSTDGTMCAWSVDMLAQPQEYLELLAPPPSKTEDLAPTCIAFPPSDPTTFLCGTEEGTIYHCHRYDRAGAKAGVDNRISYKAHTAPVMSVNFHPARGPLDLGDLVLSTSVDWTVKLWRARPSASATPSSSSDQQSVSPLREFVRDDLVYDAKWSPVRPSIFACVDGAGSLEIWDINADLEVPAAKIKPSEWKDKEGIPVSSGKPRSLNRVAWEGQEGKRVAVGGLDGVVSVFEVESGLGGKEGQRKEEWTDMKRLVSRLDEFGARGDTLI